MIQDNPKPLPQPVRVLIILDDETQRMADELAASRSTFERTYNRSSIIRKLIRAEHRRVQRQQERLAESRTS